LGFCARPRRLRGLWRAIGDSRKVVSPKRWVWRRFSTHNLRGEPYPVSVTRCWESFVNPLKSSEGAPKGYVVLVCLTNYLSTRLLWLGAHNLTQTYPTFSHSWGYFPCWVSKMRTEFKVLTDFGWCWKSWRNPLKKPTYPLRRTFVLMRYPSFAKTLFSIHFRKTKSRLTLWGICALQVADAPSCSAPLWTRSQKGR